MKKLLLAAFAALTVILPAPAWAQTKINGYAINDRTAITIASMTIVDIGTRTLTGAVFTSTGSVLIRSTTTTAGHFALNVLDNTGASVFRVNQNGALINTGAATFDGNMTLGNAGTDQINVLGAFTVNTTS